MKLTIFTAGIAFGVLAVSAHAEFHIQAGGGLHVPNGDSARFVERGYRVGAGAEWKSGHFGLLLDGAYNRDNVNSEECEKTFRENNSLPATFPVQIDGVAQIYELNLSPKFYLLDTDNIGAFLLAGGGPRWVKKRVNIDLPPSQQDRHMNASETTLGLQVGFGVEAVLPGSLRVGVSPLYHFVFAEHRVQYAALTAYLKL